jgi:hypothetical protein
MFFCATGPGVLVSVNEAVTCGNRPTTDRLSGIDQKGALSGVDTTGPPACTIQATPGGFPRGRPALYLFADMAETLICSARGCRAPARWALEWNNPKLHTPDRRKTWLACDDHRPTLASFLDARGFLRDVQPLP